MLAQSLDVSAVGGVFAVLGLFTWLFRPQAFILVLAASGAFFSTAAITVAGNSVPPFYFLAVLATLSAAASWLRGHRVRHPAVPILAVFLVWSAVITAAGPAIFAGISILDPRGGIDSQVLEPGSLTYTPSMAAQVVYLALGIGVAFFLAQSRDVGPSFLSQTFFWGSVTSVLALVPGLREPVDQLFRNYASAGYNVYEQRHAGIYVEPSLLAMFSIAAVAYGIYRLPRARGGEKIVIYLTVLASLINISLSASGTAALSIVVLIAVAFVGYSYGFLIRGARLPVAGVLVMPFFFATLLLPNPITNAIFDIIEGKSGSQSFRARTASDLFSLDLTFKTYGLGVGVGANRPSSFATMLVSSVGIVGFVLFVVAIVLVMRRAAARADWVPVVVALFALMVAKVIAEPALSTPVMWLAIGGCLHGAGAHLRERSGSAASLEPRRLSRSLRQ